MNGAPRVQSWFLAPIRKQPQRDTPQNYLGVVLPDADTNSFAELQRPTTRRVCHSETLAPEGVPVASRRPDYARRIGIDLDTLFIARPDDGAMALEIVDVLVRSTASDIVAVDSVPALEPPQQTDAEATSSR